MMRHVRRLRDERGVTIILVEHDMQAVMGLCDMHHRDELRQALAEGTPRTDRATIRV